MGAAWGYGGVQIQPPTNANIFHTLGTLRPLAESGVVVGSVSPHSTEEKTRLVFVKLTATHKNKIQTGSPHNHIGFHMAFLRTAPPPLRYTHNTYGAH